TDVEQIEVVHPRVTLLRRASGETNWDIASREPSASPVRVHLGRLRVSELVVAWTDEQTATSAEIGVSVDLTPSGRAVAVPIPLTAPGRIRWRDHETTIDAIGGRLGWNDRDMSVQALSVRLAEGAVTADGRLEDVQGDPRIDLRFVTDVDLAKISPWFDLDRPMAGSTHVDAHAVGPLPQPAITLTAAARDIRLHPLPVISIKTTATLAGN